MIFHIIISTTPDTATAQTALQSCRAIVESDGISQIFFYGNGVLLSEQHAWQEFVLKHNIQAFVCSASCDEKKLKSLPANFHFAGMLQINAALSNADRTLSFGDAYD